MGYDVLQCIVVGECFIACSASGGPAFRNKENSDDTVDRFHFCICKQDGDLDGDLYHIIFPFAQKGSTVAKGESRLAACAPMPFDCGTFYMIPIHGSIDS